MSEPLAERLSRFTPNTAGLDRDALLFAAGRASVRPSRRWQGLAGALAVSQLLTVFCLWPQMPQPAFVPNTTPFAASEPPRSAAVPIRPSESDPSELRALRQRMRETDLDYPTAPSDQPMVPPDPPLHAFGKPPPFLLN
jgi:hypothetical protein